LRGVISVCHTPTTVFSLASEDADDWLPRETVEAVMDPAAAIVAATITTAVFFVIVILPP
jgi:hypothetical protein